MSVELAGSTRFADQPRSSRAALAMRKLHIDGPLLLGVITVAIMGLVVLFSAVGGRTDLLIAQLLRLGVAFAAMFLVAQIPPSVMRRWTPWGFALGLLLLLMVLFLGEVGQGAQRWLDLGIRFQPSEIMKLAVPMMAAWYLHDRPLPPGIRAVALILLLVSVPTLLIAVQPDLGTALLIAASGVLVVLLAGLRPRVILALAFGCIAALPLLWHFMHDYQRQRVLTLLDPQSDPLGAGYNIIQSTIAIGSGGLFGRGWLAGTQAKLGFLPEKDTDFIFAVMAEEFGLLGVLALLVVYVLLVGRGMYIAVGARDTFSRLIAGSISLTFFVYVFVNIGMVCGLLPVVGVPLPLVSFGGTSMVTLLAGFGILMSIQTHRKLLAH